MTRSAPGFPGRGKRTGTTRKRFALSLSMALAMSGVGIILPVLPTSRAWGSSAQVGVALFETTFALHARTELGMGLVELGAVFMVCGLMMLVVQLGAMAPLARRWREARLASAALALIGLSLALLWPWRAAQRASSRWSPCTGSGWGPSRRPCRCSCPGVAARMQARRLGSRAVPRVWARSPAHSSVVFSSARPWPFPSGS